jgi:tetratricopeptide (TPR) repeat protein/TolB-like protein/tRNA A-37 threonylcarbamoyl transferase component Bud32
VFASPACASAMNCPQCSTINPDYAESCSHCGSLISGSTDTVQVTDTTALSAGTDFGTRYRIVSLLGQGAMGRVYKAFDKDLERAVAIKVVRPGMMAESDALRRFKQELLLASKVSHKNILRIHDLGEVGDIKFISMAYVEGSDLNKIIRDNPKMPFERILSFSEQLADALAAAHAEGVIHRDLKPQNILVAGDDHLYVSDFGLAKSFEEDAVGMTRTGVFLGTPLYMSPEQVEGKPADQRSDIYSYGLILYEMVTGAVPFTGDSTFKVMYDRLKTKPKSPRLQNPEIPAWFDRIIMRSLEKQPETRYQNANEILADLRGSRAPTASRSIQITLPEFSNRSWMWWTGWVGGAVALLASVFAIPPVRHLILRQGGSAQTGSQVAGVPALSAGKFVAVLPFKVLGDEQTLGYVAEGLNEALSAKLFQLKDLRMASDSSLTNISDKDPLEKIARSLGVNLIVDGLIQGGADKMSIIVNLHDIADGTKVWSQEFSGVPKDVLSIEDQISTQLVTALQLKPSDEEMARASERPTDNIDAYDLYLRGRQALKGPDRTKAAQAALDFFQQAIQKDSGFALAYTGVSDASLLMYENSKDSFWAQKATGAAQRAEQLKDNLPEVHFALGSVYQQTGQTTQAIAEFDRGLKLAPNSDTGYMRMGQAYAQAGQQEQAIATFKKGIEVNPYYWMLHNQLGSAYFSIGENEKALEEFKKVTELEPDNVTGWNNVASMYERMDQYQDSIPAFQKSIQLSPTWLAYCNLGNVYTTLKQYPQAIDALQKSVALGPNQEACVGNLADAYRYSGQTDKAKETYEKAIALAFQELQVNPQNTDDLGDLALYFVKKGEPERGMEFIQRARGIDKRDVELIFTQATVEALANKPADAMSTLHDALSKGYPAKDVASNPDFAALQNRPDFQALIKQFSQPPAAH